MFADEPPLPSGTVVGGYVVERMIGRGGMGEVYAAAHPVIGRRAALKVIQQQAARSATGIARFIQEARLVNQIRHPHIVDVFGFDELPDGRPVLVMELLEGQTLMRRLERGPIAEDEAIELTIQILGALSAAHSAGVIHRDLKPENLFLTTDHEGRARVKILDFGIAKLVTAPSADLGTNFAPLGTPQYMSPEQCRGETVDGRSDLYAIGLILYEMLAGRGPFVGNTPLEYVAHHLKGEPTPLSMFARVRPELEAVVMRLLSKRRDDRPPSASALERELRALSSPAHAPLGEAATMISVAPPPDSERKTAVLPPRTEENRLCTVMIADVEGLGAMDAVGSRSFVESCFERFRAVIERHGGVAKQYVGDSMIAVFGVPRSTPNDAERAVHAALQLPTVVNKLAARTRRMSGAKATLNLRVALTTGLVLVGPHEGEAARTPIVSGEPVALASRLLAMAPEATVVIARDTFLNVAGLFDVEELPVVEPRGRGEPISWYAVRGVAREGQTPPPDVFFGRETRFVGRDAELAQLREMFDQVIAERRAHCVTVVAPPGIGKTRLRDELCRALSASDEPPFMLLGRGSYLSREVPYDLAATLLRRRFHINVGDSRQVVEQKLRNGIRSFGRVSHHANVHDPDEPDLRSSFLYLPRAAERGEPELDPGSIGEGIDSLATMLGARAEGGLTAVGDSVDDARARMSAAVARLLQLVSSRAPVVILCDGLEAADDASLDLLDYLLVRLAELPLYFVCFARPELFERRPHWGEGSEAHSRMSLAVLSRKAMDDLTRDALADAPVHADLLRWLSERAGGNALVLRETVRVLREAGAIELIGGSFTIDLARANTIALPSTVYGIVQARLDRLAPELKSLAQRAAVIGRVFWEGAIEAMNAKGDGPTGQALRDALDSLRRAEVIRARERSVFPSTREYIFADTVTREVAYESISLRACVRHHRAVAGWLELQGNAVVEGNPGLLAFHYDRGGVLREAIKYYVNAGARAASLGNGGQALRHYQCAAEIAEASKAIGFPEGSQHDTAEVAAFAELRVATWQQRVDLRIALGDVLRRLGRVEEARDSYEEAQRDILRTERRRGPTVDPALVARYDGTVALRLGLVAKARGDQPVALEYYRRAFALLTPTGDPGVLAELYAAYAHAQYLSGRLGEAFESCRVGLRTCSAIARGAPDRTDAASRLLTTMGAICYSRGELVRAERCYRQAVRVIDEDRFPQLAAIARTNLGAVHFRARDYARAHAEYARSLQLMERIGNLRDIAVAYSDLAALQLTAAEVNPEVAELTFGSVAPALQNARRSLQLAEALNAGDLLPTALQRLSSALLRGGEPIAALDAAERAFRLSLGPDGRSTLASASQTWAECCVEAAAVSRQGTARRARVDASVARAREEIGRALLAVGMRTEASRCSTILDSCE